MTILTDQQNPSLAIHRHDPHRIIGNNRLTDKRIPSIPGQFVTLYGKDFSFINSLTFQYFRNHYTVPPSFKLLFSAKEQNALFPKILRNRRQDRKSVV